MLKKKKEKKEVLKKWRWTIWIFFLSFVAKAFKSFYRNWLIEFVFYARFMYWTMKESHGITLNLQLISGKSSGKYYIKNGRIPFAHFMFIFLYKRKNIYYKEMLRLFIYKMKYREEGKGGFYTSFLLHNVCAWDVFTSVKSRMLLFSILPWSNKTWGNF